MTSRNRKQKRPKRLPAIVPRFLKGAVTIGAIPTLLGACDKRHRPAVVAAYSQPVVAAYVPQPDQPPVAGDAAVDAPAVVAPPPPVVAAYVRHEAPPRPVPTDAGVDAPRAPKKQKAAIVVPPPPPPPPPVVAAYVRPPPPVVAAYVPRPAPPGGPPAPTPSTPKKSKKP